MKKMRSTSDRALMRRYREGACKQSSTELEIDDRPKVSMGSDPGAFVQAWIWVTNEDAGIYQCPSCGELYDTEGDTTYTTDCPACEPRGED